MSLALVIAAAPKGEAAKSGPIGLAVILILCIVCYFLLKSMSKHLRAVRESFPVQPPRRRGQAPVEPAQQPVPPTAEPAQPGDAPAADS